MPLWVVIKSSLIINNDLKNYAEGCLEGEMQGKELMDIYDQALETLNNQLNHP